MSINFNINTDPVEHAKSDSPIVVDPQISIRKVFSLLQAHGTGSVLVCEDNKLVGIFTERDALKLMAADAPLDVPLETVMVRDPVTISCNAPIAEAVKLMSTGGYRRLPIVNDDDQLEGVVKVSGILHYFVDHFPEAVFNLPPDPNVIMPEREGA